MDRQNGRTPHAPCSSHVVRLKISLLPLESVLIAAEKSAPPRAPRLLPDPDETLAIKLIENIRHPQAALLRPLQVEPSRPLTAAVWHGMAGEDV